MAASPRSKIPRWAQVLRLIPLVVEAAIVALCFIYKPPYYQTIAFTFIGIFVFMAVMVLIMWRKFRAKRANNA